jgi:MATE family multidrug resistance protein
MGTSGLTAQAYGAKDDIAIRRIFIQSLGLALIAGFILILLRKPLGELFLAIMSPETSTASLAKKYFQITMFGAPALLTVTSMSGWFLGMQNTVRPMIIAIGVNLLNMTLSILLVFVFKLGFIGVAYGTMISNWLGAIVAILLALPLLPQRRWKISFSSLFNTSELKRFMSVNTDILLRSACIIAVTMGVNSIGARMGNETLAANAVMMQFFHIFSYFMDGIAFTGEALCGRFAGAKDEALLKRCIKYLCTWGAAIAIIFFIIYLLFGRVFAGWITSDATVIEAVNQYYLWVILIPPLTVGAFIFDGIFIGLTATRRMLTATLSAAIIFFAVCYLRIYPTLHISFPDNDLLWIAFLSYLVARGLLLAIMTPQIVKLKQPS